MTSEITAKIRSIWKTVLEIEAQLWTCRHCGAQTTVLSEYCSKCGKEDLEQGS